MRLQRELPTPAATDRAAACPDGAARQATSPQDAQRLRLADGHFDKCEYAHALPLYEQARASFEKADHAGDGTLRSHDRMFSACDLVTWRPTSPPSLGVQG